MQIEIRPDQEWIVTKGVASGRFKSAEEFISDVLAAAGGAVAEPSDEQLQALAQEARDLGGYRERGPDWKAEILAMAREPEAAASSFP